MRCQLLAYLLCMCALPAQADISTPLLYTRTQIIIERKDPPHLPWQTVTPEMARLAFDTEVRDGATLYNQKGWFNLSSQSEQHAILLPFGAPVIAPIIPSAHYSPIDILLVNKEGTIMAIFPKLMLSTLEEEIYPDEPFSAFLFLKGGACEALSIKPGDDVIYKLFRKPPTTWTAPTPPTPAPPINPPGTL